MSATCHHGVSKYFEIESNTFSISQEDTVVSQYFEILHTKFACF
jgi:hypothetical protein